jgi:pyruvate dehydrogenase E2 component (dihydrolipoyllysine-residue acetyltransferase)
MATAVVEVVMPQMGVSVSEGTILKWLKQVGDTVEADEPLLEISTDKVDTEVPSPGSGVVQEILVQEGETVEVGSRLAVIAPEGEAEAEPEPPVRDSGPGEGAPGEPGGAGSASPPPPPPPPLTPRHPPQPLPRHPLRRRRPRTAAPARRHSSRQSSPASRPNTVSMSHRCRARARVAA